MIVTISSLQPKSTDVRSILAILGSTGNSAILRPSLVSIPSSSNALKAYRCSNALINVYIGGGSMKSNLIKSFIPIALSIKTVLAKLVL